MTSSGAGMGLAQICSATAAGCATTIVGHPLDSIKVHLQNNSSYRNTWSAARSLYTEKALFRGIAPPLANAIIMNTVMFSVFATVKESIGSDSMGAALLAGTLSGLATACISTPTDFIKIQAQLRGVKSIEILQRLQCNDGLFSIRTLFRGHVANLCREGVFTMAYLGLYDQAKAEGFWQVALVSSLTGGMAWVLSYPFDTIKSVIQGEEPQNFSKISAVRRIWKQGGIAAFYRGCGASTGRAMMVTSLRMIVYEWVVRIMENNNDY